MTGRWKPVLASAIAIVVILFLILQKNYTHQTNKLRMAKLTTTFDTELERSDAPLGTQERLDSPSGTQKRLDALSGSPAQCANHCSPCSKSPEYWNLTCHDIIETQAKKRKPQLEYRRKVILSSDTENVFYAWFAPITSLLWMEVMKWKPVYIFVYRAESDIGPVFKYIIKHVKAAGAEVIKIRNTLPEPHYLRSMVVSTSRFVVSCRDWPGNPYMLISDGDMWPMSTEIFNQQTSVERLVHILWPKTYVVGKSVIPACYVGMNLSTWREIMHITKGDDMLQTIAGLRNLVGNGSLSKNAQWGVDQKVFTKRLYHWRGFPQNVHFYPHDRSEDRLDRALMSKRFTWHPGLLDAHLLRPGFTPQHWPQLRQLAALFLNEERMKWVDAYTERFCRLLFCTENAVEDNRKPYFHPSL